MTFIENAGYSAFLLWAYITKYNTISYHFWFSITLLLQENDEGFFRRHWFSG